MAGEKKVKNGVIRVVKGDLTMFEADALVFYARPDLLLGSGFGSAISVRGGPTIQQELKQFGEVEVGQAVVTAAGNLKAKKIVHAVGPRFQEADMENKLRATITSALKKADEAGAKSVVMPPMGAGFYGVPLDVSAAITIETAEQYLNNGSGVTEITICVLDLREFKAFDAKL
jgi:O-acetyl-ADP-ribose deacetylase (regulator of RNase III)